MRPEGPSRRPGIFSRRRPGWLRLAAIVSTGILAMTAGWGVSLAVRGARARLVPEAQTPRAVEHATVVREEGTGRYLLYTEIQIRPGDVLILPGAGAYRVVRVDFDTAWALYAGPSGGG